MNRIKQLRLEKNMKQDVLAKLLGLEVAGFSKLETGRVPLKDEYIIKLANYFEVSTDYLLGKTDIRNEKTLDLSDEEINFIKNIKKLSETEKKVIRDTMEAFLDNKQNKEK